MSNELELYKAQLAKFEEKLHADEVMSVGKNPVALQLLDYEIHFRKNYWVRFNEVSTMYEKATYFIDERGDEELFWDELNEKELMNDMIRARAKQRGTLSDAEIGRLLSDRRIVPAYNPFAGYFKSLLFDGNFGYIDELADHVKVEGGTKEQERWLVNFKKAMVRTVKCALDDKYFNKHCLTLHSTDQSIGKTSFLRSLVPVELKKFYYEGMIGGDKDSQTVLAKNFFILIDELANLSRVDINVLKAILSKLNVNIRLPYEKNFTEMPRRASFFATTNRTDFLVDDQNVRWVIFSVEDIDRSYGNIFTGEFKIDINKVWAEAYALYLDPSFNCELTKEDMAVNEDNNVMYSATSLEKEVINHYFSPADASDNNKKGYRKLQSGEVFELACQMLQEDGKEFTLKNIRQNVFFIELGRVGWKKTSFRVGKKVVSGYHLLVNKEIDESELPI